MWSVSFPKNGSDGLFTEKFTHWFYGLCQFFADERSQRPDVAGGKIEANACGTIHLGDGLGVSELQGFLVLTDGFSGVRSEEHTSELKSLMRNSYAVFCL